MKLVRLTDTSAPYFKEAWQLYHEAFPIEERRVLEEQVLIMQKENYYFDVVLSKGKFIGFCLWWNLDTIRYIDYFATIKTERNKGYGKLILEKFLLNNNKAVILEVELPNSDINQRRIKFYERIGFKRNQHYYTVPNAIEGEPPLQLLLMTYPSLISEKEMKNFIENCDRDIY